ncbi:MAG: enterochelin esterase [Phycisphaerae bacterium]|nr:enterochelin esterase [Phycisphaerae bacterium]
MVAFFVVRACIGLSLAFSDGAGSVREPWAARTDGAVISAGVARGPVVSVRFDPKTRVEGFSGRVFLAVSLDENSEPRLRMGDWFGGSVVFATDAEGIAPNGIVEVDLSAVAAHPKQGLESLRGKRCSVQAVAKCNPDSPSAGDGPGDLYSEVGTLEFNDAGERVALALSSTVQARDFTESERVKLVEIVSPSLSAFLGRERKIRAGVVLPEGWQDDALASYPTVYFITGFGGDHFGALGMARGMPPEAGRVLLVVPDPSCGLGHSVFADSANNGPWGRALMEELIPEVERRFHGAGDGSRRYVTGISSGGWSSLWLQVTYPDSLSGVWSHCPDPVDFRDFQRIDLYAPGANMYIDAAGARRPLAREGDRVMLWYDDFVHQETVMGPGGQIHSFEAVFSPRGGGGRPRPLFDRVTGRVDAVTARSWERYDIRLLMERNWATLGPKLVGKIHVYAGGSDTFYLDGAARLLGESLRNLGSDAIVEIVPNMPHTMHGPGIDAMFRTIRERHPRP